MGRKEVLYVCALAFLWAAPAAGADDIPPEPVIGLALAGQQKAYPLSLFKSVYTVNDEVGRLAVVVFYDPEKDYAAAFFRLVGGEPLEFSGRALGSVADDLTTSTRWDMATGRAVSGNLVGQSLVPIPTKRLHLSQWLTAFPKSAVFQAQ